MKYLQQPLTGLWLVLAMATTASWSLGAEGAPGISEGSSWLALSILSITMVKCRLVIRHYMEVRDAPSWLRWSCDAWLTLNFAMITAFYRLAS